MKPLPGKSRQIGEPLSGAERHKANLRFHRCGNKSVTYFVAHFKNGWPNTRAQPSQNSPAAFVTSTLGTGLEGRHRSLQHTYALRPQQTTPTCMGRNHSITLCVAKQHWQAVRHHHGASHAPLHGDGSICSDTVCRLTVNLLHVNTMYLVQKDHMRVQSSLQTLPIGQYGLGHIPNMGSQVQTGVHPA